jgi:hypothetical protein
MNTDRRAEGRVETRTNTDEHGPTRMARAASAFSFSPCLSWCSSSLRLLRLSAAIFLFPHPCPFVALFSYSCPFVAILPFAPLAPFCGSLPSCASCAFLWLACSFPLRGHLWLSFPPAFFLTSPPRRHTMNADPRIGTEDVYPRLFDHGPTAFLRVVPFPTEERRKERLYRLCGMPRRPLGAARGHLLGRTPGAARPGPPPASSRRVPRSARPTVQGEEHGWTSQPWHEHNIRAVGAWR